MLTFVSKVTPFANQYERQSILDAADIAGLNVLTLMHDETAGKSEIVIYVISSDNLL